MHSVWEATSRRHRRRSISQSLLCRILIVWMAGAIALSVCPAAAGKRIPIGSGLFLKLHRFFSRAYSELVFPRTFRGPVYRVATLIRSGLRCQRQHHAAGVLLSPSVSASLVGRGGLFAIVASRCRGRISGPFFSARTLRDESQPCRLVFGSLLSVWMQRT